MTMHVIGLLLTCSLAWWGSSHGFYHQHHRGYWPRSLIQTRGIDAHTCQQKFERPQRIKIENCEKCDFYGAEPECDGGSRYCEHGVFLNKQCDEAVGKRAWDCCKARGEKCTHDDQCLPPHRCVRNTFNDPTNKTCRFGTIPAPGPIIVPRRPDENLYDYTLDQSLNILDPFKEQRMIEEYYEEI